MHRRSLLAGLVGASATATLALSGCGSETADAQPAGAKVTVETARGKVEVPVKPERVVVFDTATLDTMAALDLKPAGAPSGVALPDAVAKHLEGVPGVGTLFEPDLEKVNELNPQLIIIGGRSAKAYDQLAKIAPTIDLTMPKGDVHEALKVRATAVGTIFGREGDVAAKLGEIDAKVASVKAAAKGAGKALIVMVSGGKLTAFGKGGRFALVHDTLGVAEAAPVKAESHGQQISFEFIAKADPDVLFVIDRDSAVGEKGAKAAREVLDTPLVKNTKAVRNEKLVELDGRNWYIVSNGLTTLPMMLDQVQSGLSR